MHIENYDSTEGYASVSPINAQLSFCSSAVAKSCFAFRVSRSLIRFLSFGISLLPGFNSRARRLRGESSL